MIDIYTMIQVLTLDIFACKVKSVWDLSLDFPISYASSEFCRFWK